jgi:ABC-type amino acid transport substrate-binding protein
MKTSKLVILMCVWCVARTVVAQERLPEQPRDTLVIALRNDLPPMSFLNVDGQLTGLFVDIWNVWAAKTGQPIAFRAATWQETLDSLQNGAADVIGALYASEDRRAWMAWN